jgi:hypothetical protein
MPAVISTRQLPADRQRRVHAKSRKGCGNCKIRRIKVSYLRIIFQIKHTNPHKCDELRPHCKRCKLYGVACNYGKPDASLQLSNQGSFQVDITSPASQEQVIDFNTPEQDSLEPYQIASSQRPAIDLARSSANPGSGSMETSTKANSADLSAASQPEQRMNPSMTPLSPLSLHASMATMIDSSVQLGFSGQGLMGSAAPYWHFSESHLEILTRFQARTSLTIGIKQLAPAYRDCVCQLAFTVSLRKHLTLSSCSSSCW